MKIQMKIYNLNPKEKCEDTLTKLREIFNAYFKTVKNLTAQTHHFNSIYD